MLGRIAEKRGEGEEAGVGGGHISETWRISPLAGGKREIRPFAAKLRLAKPSKRRDCVTT